MAAGAGAEGETRSLAGYRKIRKAAREMARGNKLPRRVLPDYPTSAE